MSGTDGAAPLARAADEALYGGKAAQLARALSAGLPVPDGFALAWPLVDRVVAGDAAARAAVSAIVDELEVALAVRSSAVGEDGATASFAGQHATKLHVRGAPAVLDAIAEVWGSGRTASALAYRRKLGIAGEPRVAVVLQLLVPAEVAGVLFSKNPVTGADERVIEAAWGLGEAVVAGLVTADRYRVARSGRVLERTVGEKDLVIVPRVHGGTEERVVDGARASAPCLDDARLAELEALATRCEAVFGGAQDLEFAFAHSRLHLLQRRSVTGLAR